MEELNEKLVYLGIKNEDETLTLFLTPVHKKDIDLYYRLYKKTIAKNKKKVFMVPYKSVFYLSKQNKK